MILWKKVLAPIEWWCKYWCPGRAQKAASPNDYIGLCYRCQKGPKIGVPVRWKGLIEYWCKPCLKQQQEWNREFEIWRDRRDGKHPKGDVQ